MYQLTTHASFDSAHFLSGYEGKCSNIHGHRWKLEVTVQSETLEQTGQIRGMVVDFGQLKDDIKKLADEFDHSLIIEDGTLKEKTVEALKEKNFKMIFVDFRPTAESFAKYFYDRVKEIGYDVSGNPLIYYDGKIMDWMNGRILQAIHTDVGNVSYEYNSNGVRTAKTVNNIRTEYLRDAEDRLLGEETQGEYLWYLYDATGKAAGYEWQGNSYYYVRNAMGDVEGISDMEGNLLCSYYYDAWGNVTEVTGDKELAEKNSIRYRGYYYDEESGFYYLKTRYYDPEAKRFLNRDCLENESNLYQYCYNNPVNYSDESGMSAYSCSDRYVEIVEFIQPSTLSTNWKNR